jgi:phosphopantetheinyl transferase (holo-ACP synthase)
MQENVFETMGIGIDVEDVQRFENLSDRSFAAFLKKNFTKLASHFRGVPHG